MNKELKTGIRGLSIVCSDDGVWLCTKSDTGKSCMLNLSNIAKEKGNLIGIALFDWCVQTAKEAVDLGLRRQGLKIGDRVKWKSQSRSYWTTKVGTIVAVVPPGSNPVIPEGFKGNSSTGYGLCGRKNESYLVRVDGKGNRLYWPTASLKAI